MGTLLRLVEVNNSTRTPQLLVVIDSHRFSVATESDGVTILKAMGTQKPLDNTTSIEASPGNTPNSTSNSRKHAANSPPPELFAQIPKRQKVSDDEGQIFSPGTPLGHTKISLPASSVPLFGTSSSSSLSTSSLPNSPINSPPPTECLPPSRLLEVRDVCDKCKSIGQFTGGNHSRREFRTFISDMEMYAAAKQWSSAEHAFAIYCKCALPVRQTINTALPNINRGMVSADTLIKYLQQRYCPPPTRQEAISVLSQLVDKKPPLDSLYEDVVEYSGEAGLTQEQTNSWYLKGLSPEFYNFVAGQLLTHHQDISQLPLYQLHHFVKQLEWESGNLPHQSIPPVPYRPEVTLLSPPRMAALGDNTFSQPSPKNLSISPRNRYFSEVSLGFNPNISVDSSTSTPRGLSSPYIQPNVSLSPGYHWVKPSFGNELSQVPLIGFPSQIAIRPGSKYLLEKRKPLFMYNNHAHCWLKLGTHRPGSSVVGYYDDAGRLLCYNCGGQHRKALCPHRRGNPVVTSTSITQSSTPMEVSSVDTSRDTPMPLSHLKDGSATSVAASKKVSRSPFIHCMLQSHSFSHPPYVLLTFTRVGRVEVAMLDTGAMKSIIDQNYLTKHLPQLQPAIIPSCHPKLESISGDALHVNGQLLIDITLGDCNYQTEFLIVSGSQLPIILGIDFLDGLAKAHLDLHHHCLLTVGGHAIPLLDHANDGLLICVVTTSIPARSQIIVDARLYCSSVTSDKEGTLEPIDASIFHPGLLVASSIDIPRNNIVHVQVMNCQPAPVVIHSGTYLGRWVKTDWQYSPPCDIATATTILTQLTKDVDSSKAPPTYRYASRQQKNGGYLLEAAKLPSESSVVQQPVPLTKEQQQQLDSFLSQYKEVFAVNPKQPDLSKAVPHRIEVSGGPIHQQLRRVNPIHQEVHDKAIADMIANHIIRPSKSEWASPIVLVPKKDGTIRFCVDFRALNAVTKKDVYPLPRIDDVIDALGKARIFSTLDLASGYWQIPMAPEDIPKTAFITRKGLFEFLRMPFGLCNAPSTFQRAMDVMLSGLTWDLCLVYIDDIIVYSSDFNTHLKHLSRVFDRVIDAGYHLRRDKCHFCCQQVLYLGHLVSARGVEPDPAKVLAIKQLRPPRNPHEVRQFLGLTGYYRRFIKDYAKLARPLFELIKQQASFKWTPQRESSFNALRLSLMIHPVLIFPDFSQPFVLQTDASDVGIGAILAQKDSQGHEHVVSYYSRVLSPAESHYSTFEKETLAAVAACHHFRIYLLPRPFDLYTDNSALTYILRMKEPNARVTRWILQLQEYHFSIHYRPGTANANADALSRPPVVDRYPVLSNAQDFEVNSHNTFSHHDKCNSFTSSHLSIGAIVLPGYANNTLREQQLLIPTWKALIEYLETGKPPPDPAQHHLVMSLAPQYELIKGVLHQCIIPPRGHEGEVYCRICLPPEARPAALIAAHVDAQSGHQGQQRTYAKLFRNYYWPRMYTECEKFCEQCNICQEMKTSRRKGAGLMQPILASYPWHKVEVDAVTMLPETLVGNRHLIVFTDIFSKYVEAFPVRDLTTETFAKLFVDQIICRHGCPVELISDQGGNFLSKLVLAICAVLSIRKISTTPYHPRTNGQVERLNHSLIQILRTLLQNDTSNWDEHIPSLCYAYNTMEHSTTKFSPFFLLYGRDPLCPLDLAWDTFPEDTPASERQYAEELLRRLSDCRSIAQMHMEHSQDSRKARFDFTRSDVRYTVGTRVWLRKFAVKPGQKKKLLSQWVGPFVILAQRSPLNYLIQATPRSRIISAHVENLKPFHQSVDETPQEVTVTPKETHVITHYGEEALLDHPVSSSSFSSSSTSSSSVIHNDDVDEDISVIEAVDSDDDDISIIEADELIELISSRRSAAAPTNNSTRPQPVVESCDSPQKPALELSSVTRSEASEGLPTKHLRSELDHLLSSGAGFHSDKARLLELLSSRAHVPNPVTRARLLREVERLSSTSDVTGYIQFLLSHLDAVSK